MSECSNCGEKYYEEDHIPDEEYMYQMHKMNECPNPNKMERAFLKASPMEREEVWPNYGSSE